MTPHRGVQAQGPLEQLIYISESVAPVASALQMSDILATARPNNRRDAITGALTAAAGRFIQIIEGPAASLDDLLARLRADTRHREVQIVARCPIDARDFPDWEMVSPRLAPDEIAVLADLLGRQDAGLDDYVPVLRRALARQGAVLDR